MKSISKKHIIVVSILCIAFIYLICRFLLYPHGKGSLTIKFIGINAESVFVKGEQFSSRVYTRPDKNTVFVSPLPYGPYTIQVEYVDFKNFSVKFWHENNWHKEKIIFSRPDLGDVGVKASHSIEGSKKVIHKDIDLSSQKEIVRLGYI